MPLHVQDKCFGDIARCVLACRGLTRLHMGMPVDNVLGCLSRGVFAELDAAAGASGGGGGGVGGGGGGGGGGSGAVTPGTALPAALAALTEFSLEQNPAADDDMLAAVARHRQGLTLVHFTANPEPLLSLPYLCHPVYPTEGVQR